MGQRVECTKRDDPKGRVGSSVTLRRGELVTIAGCATPAREPRVGRRCEGAWWVEGLRGVGFAAPKSQVRARQRPPREMCDEWNRDFGRELSALLDAGISTVPEAREGLGEVIPRGDLPFPHRAGGHRCCWRGAEHERARAALSRLADVEMDARARATEAVLSDLIEEGSVDPGDRPEDLTGHRRDLLRERVEALVSEELAGEPGYREALEHEEHCSGLWDLWIGRAMPDSGTYAGGLAAVKRRARAGRYGSEDDLVQEILDLRGQYEVGSTRPLVGEWFGWSSGAKEAEEREYSEQRRGVRGERRRVA